MTTEVAQWLIVVGTLLVVLVGLGLARKQRSRPRLPPAKSPGPLYGADVRVANAIERGAPLEDVIREAELLAYRQHNLVVPRDQQARPSREDREAYDALSIPHVTATTPKVAYNQYPACPDCEFETLTMFGGEVAIPIRTLACPKHQRDPR